MPISPPPGLTLDSNDSVRPPEGLTLDVPRGTSAESTGKSGLLESAFNATPIAGISSLYHTFADPQREGENLHDNPFIPAALARGGERIGNSIIASGKDSVSRLKQAGTDAKNGQYGAAMADALEATPLLGGFMQQQEQNYEPGDTEGNLKRMGGTLSGTLGSMWAPVGVAKAAPIARTLAIGDTDAAALRGLRVAANGKKVLPMQSSVQTARPCLQGASSLEDMQARVPAAKTEAFAPYKQTLDAVGNNPVKGPDGMTTIRALEDERQELSAMNRGLKSGDPSALRLAEQKGMSQAESLAREKAIQQHLDPELSRYGIDPQAIRKTYGAISRIGNQVEGRSTLLEKPQPSGFGRMANIDLKSPKTWLGEPIRGVRDLIAGRPALSMSPSDVGIREGFANAGPKPNFGQYTPFKPVGLLGKPPITLSASPEIGGTPEGYRPPNFYYDTDAMRTGRLLNAPPIELGGRVEGTRPPPFRYDTTPMRMGRLLPADTSESRLPMSSHTEMFPEQLPGGSRKIPHVFTNRSK